MAYGNGAFGRWITDERGLPAYEYTMDQTRDSRAEYATTTGGSRDHWHLLGNDRLLATAHNGGYVQLYDWTRGPRLVNRWEPAKRNYSGGFKLIRAGDRTLDTLWEHLPEDATQRRIFGVGYFEKITRWRDLLVAETIEAPPGDDPVLRSVTTLDNQGDAPIDLTVVEFWDVNPHQLTPAMSMIGQAGTRVQQRRAELNRQFVMDARWDADLRVLSVDLAAASPTGIPAPGERSQIDYHPKTTFLAALDALPGAFKAFAVDQEIFFGKERLERDGTAPPGLDGAADGRLFEKRPALGGKALLAIRRSLRLGPRSRVRLQYLYGYAARQTIPELIHRAGAPRPPRKLAGLELSLPGASWLHRELLWHSYYLQAGAVYQDFHETHFVDQGSAYGYLHGASGAHRDFALFTLPMIYLRPALAREMLSFTMRAQDAKTGGLPYAHIGYGMVSGAMIYGRPSDLDLFYLWALSEYLAATRDLAFLDERVPFYPPTAGAIGTVLEHARLAFRHLTQTVGVGPHGLLRCGSGDWNDELIRLSPKPKLTREHGESSLNAGLATVALPAMADVIEETDPSLAEALRAFATGQARALRSLWTGGWVARGFLGQADEVLGKDRIFLDAQPFGVLGGVWQPQQADKLFDRIRTLCVEPQRVGALCLVPPYEGRRLEPGSDTNGGTWAAIDSWVAWAWSRVDPAQARTFYLSTTLAARAEAYPNTWYGVWSGPDSYNAHSHPRPEGTFNVNFTPMTDFPVMNMNRHAGVLLGAIKLAGVWPRRGRIEIDPRLGSASFVLRLPLLGAAYLPDRHRGYYVPVVDGEFRFAVRSPEGLRPEDAVVTVQGRRAEQHVEDGRLLVFNHVGRAKEPIRWEIHPR
ncbi:MAG: hypothetical protein JXQ73_21005 [Phycisphaerae bacterium]|nr:hypothetical protein [Phycisphaerae bacterium]